MSPITLLYRGRLLGSNDKKNKHEIREQFREQLRQLWENPPMDLYHCRIGGDHLPVTRGFRFQPTLQQACVTCELIITVLSRSKPGSLYHDGDLDNRLKNLFDALHIPQENGLPEDFVTAEKLTNYEVLLDDDRAITDFTVRSATLLKPKLADEPFGYAEVTVEVKVKTHNQI